MTSVFVDVGACEGLASEAALEVFDIVCAFEPSLVLYEQMLHNVGGLSGFYPYCLGWWSHTTIRTLYSAGNCGGSLFKDKPVYYEAGKGQDQEAFLIRASDWCSRYLRKEDRNVLKLNCEGAELEILLDLMDSGEISKFSAIAVDFDSLKIPSRMALVSPVASRLDKTGIPLMAVSPPGDGDLTNVVNGLDQRSRNGHPS